MNRLQVLGVATTTCIAILFTKAGQNWGDNFRVRLQKAKLEQVWRYVAQLEVFLNALMVTTTRDEHLEGKG